MNIKSLSDTKLRQLQTELVAHLIQHWDAPLDNAQLARCDELDAVHAEMRLRGMVIDPQGDVDYNGLKDSRQIDYPEDSDIDTRYQ